MLAGTGCAPSVVLRLGMRDLLRFEMPKFLWEPVVQWLAIRHRRGLRDGLVFCALHRPQLGLALTCDGVRNRFLRHQAVLLGSTIYTLSGIAAMHSGLLYGRRTMPLLPYLVRHMRRCEPRKELANYLAGLVRPART
jgi:hypothetical protein